MKQDFNDNRAYTPKEIADWIARYRASGLGLRAFAAKHGLRQNRTIGNYFRAKKV